MNDYRRQELPRDYVRRSPRLRRARFRLLDGGNEPLTDAELRELEGVVEQHKTVREVSQGYGVFSSFCIPRLLATIRQLELDVARFEKERDDALALLPNRWGSARGSAALVPVSTAPILRPGIAWAVQPAQLSDLLGGQRVSDHRTTSPPARADPCSPRAHPTAASPRITPRQARHT